jgi:hypothetical protein
MRINQLEIAATPVGKFIGCALMGVREHLAEMDLQDLDIKIMVDGHEVDVRQVFSAWEDLSGAAPAVSEYRLNADDDNVSVSRETLRDLASRVNRQREALYHVDSSVEDAFDEVRRQISAALRGQVEDRLHEAVSENSMGDPCYDVRSELEDIFNEIDELLNEAAA